MIWPDNFDLLDKMSRFLNKNLSLPEDETFTELLKRKVFSMSEGKKMKWSLTDFF